MMELERSRNGSAENGDLGRKQGRRKTKKYKVVTWAVAALVILGILFTILGLTVFKPKHPEITIDSTSLQGLNIAFDIVRLRVYVNATIRVNLTAKNPNVVGFRYGATSAPLKYKDQVVGEAPIPAGNIGAGETLPMSITSSVLADRLLSDPTVFQAVRSGSLPLSTYIKLSGEVQFIIKIKVTSSSDCSFDIDIINRAIANQTCHYKTKI